MADQPADRGPEPEQQGPRRARSASEDAAVATPLGEIIRRQRELSTLSMRTLARTVGISNPYLSQIERGLREPSERVLDAIAEALELSTDALHAEAGVGRGEESETPAVVTAIRADRRLSARQRQALIDVYEAFSGSRRAR